MGCLDMWCSFKCMFLIVVEAVWPVKYDNITYTETKIHIMTSICDLSFN